MGCGFGPARGFERRLGSGCLFGGLIPFHRLGCLDQRMFEHFGHMGHRNDRQPFLHIVRNIGQILLVLLRD